MGAYYNEHDPFAVAWLRELIKAGHIAPGEVDDRDLQDVCAEDLRGFAQHHFFAGIGVWSRALRNAGWPDDQPVWTGSCPCQPFSSAGKGLGFDDERHLWPAWFWLLVQCRPDVVLGEQVESPAGKQWLDLVSTDLEAVDYTVGAAVFPAAGVGAPERRHRLYWVANANGRDASAEGLQRRRQHRLLEESGRADVLGYTSGARGRWHAGAVLDQEEEGSGERCATRNIADESFPPSAAQLLADADRSLGGQGCADAPGGDHRGDAQPRPRPCSSSSPGQLGDARHEQRPRRLGAAPDVDSGCEAWQLEGHEPPPPPGGAGAVGSSSTRLAFGSEPPVVSGALRDEGPAPGAAGAVRGFWADADWVWCRDGVYRPVEPGTFPLADGAPARVGRLRGYGNALVEPQARAFVQAVIAALP